MRKNIFCLLFCTFCLLSCSDDSEVDSIPVDTRLKLKAEKEIIEPFEKLKVSVDQDLDIIYQTYDSISWIANGVFWDGLIVIGGEPKDERDSYFVDYELGEHQIIILGYKDKMLLSSDTIKYTVKAPEGDFLNIRWGTEKGSTSSLYLGDYAPLKITYENGYYKSKWISFDLFRTYTSSYPEKEYAILDFTPSTHTSNFSRSISDLPHVNDFDWHDGSDEGFIARGKYEYEFLYNYITDLYGTPLYDFKGSTPSETDLMEEYQKRVSQDIAKYGYENPVAIWELSNSNVILTRAENNIRGVKSGSVCKIIAVPRS